MPIVVFVYGTLRVGQHANHLINTGDNYLGNGIITSPCRIASLRAFPAICTKLQGEFPPVVDAYLVEEENIPKLDRYEGFPHLYTKAKVLGNIGGEQLEGNIYVMDDPNDTVDMPELPNGDWLEVQNAD